jgi:hypothetical protein
MTNAELLDLLREAKGLLPRCGTFVYPCDCMVCKVKVGIATALAERQNSVKDVVEPVEMRWDWHEVNSPNRLAALLMDGTRVECHRANYNGVVGWSWNAMIQPVGFARTLDEAKAAAIAAARGMK